MRHRLIPAALAAGASLALLAGTAMAATPTWTVVPSVNPSATTLNATLAATDPDRAEHIANSITDETTKASALAAVAAVLAATSS